MQELYQVTAPNRTPEQYASLLGAADIWREARGNAVVEQISASGEVIRVVPEIELLRAVDRIRGQSMA
jgi:hypothetical protein